MALVQNKYSYPYSNLPGDLEYSVQNRILLEIANFLTNNGFTMVHAYYPSPPLSIDTVSNRYTFHVIDNIYIHFYYYYGNKTLRFTLGFGPLRNDGFIIGYALLSNRDITMPSSGILEFNYISSNNSKILIINNVVVFSCFLFSKGWGACDFSYNRLALEIDGLLYLCSKVAIESAFAMTDTNEKHLLLNPIFTRNKEPRKDNNYKIDDELIYMGECYVYPASMGTLQEKIFYISSDGTKYFNGGMLKNILIVD